MKKGVKKGMKNNMKGDIKNNMKGNMKSDVKNRVKGGVNKDFYWKSLFFLIAVFLIVFAIWLWTFGYKNCEDRECFNEALKNCERVKFVYGNSMIFEYVIKGEKNGFCDVGVILLQGDLNNEDSMKLEGQKMDCMLPLGVVMAPESDIGNCHGILKEGLQDLAIRKLHTYLVKNLGRLNLEMADLPKV